ncbi:hypothetical protein C2G38_2157295 [Gigaspora rosea]|uniref:Uncharacterized protein n=1 Tax=Gigaspora rosea TaxID=44941 RepID=A0A397W5T6_9GLOM|nr:hypothetical protein C2G38_2157295 [Gigaspora rosea]
MVNANEWLNKKIPTDQREQATSLYVYRKCQCTEQKNLTSLFKTTQPSGLFGGTTAASPFSGFGYGSQKIQPPEPLTTTAASPCRSFSVAVVKPTTGNNYNDCQHCSNRDQTNYSNYRFYNVILEGELDLNDFINLNVLCIEGIGQEQQQKLTSCKPNLRSINFIGNKRLIFCDNVLKNQIERLTNLILTTKNVSFIDLKIETKKVKEENLKCQLDIIKSNLNEDNKLWLDSLLEAQHEVLHSNSTYARKQLERCKNKLSEVLTVEEIRDILGNTVEINEMEAQLNKVTSVEINEMEAQLNKLTLKN